MVSGANTSGDYSGVTKVYRPPTDFPTTTISTGDFTYSFIYQLTSNDNDLYIK